MSNDPFVYLQHILESIEYIEEYMNNVSYETFLDDHQIQDSVIRRLEIIGEAAKHIPDELRGKSIDVMWQQVTGMRDVLIHDYMDVDIKLVWNTVTDKLPSLKQSVQELLDEKDSGTS